MYPSSPVLLVLQRPDSSCCSSIVASSDDPVPFTVISRVQPLSSLVSHSQLPPLARMAVGIGTGAGGGSSSSTLKRTSVHGPAPLSFRFWIQNL